MQGYSNVDMQGESRDERGMGNQKAEQEGTNRNFHNPYVVSQICPWASTRQRGHLSANAKVLAKGGDQTPMLRLATLTEHTTRSQSCLLQDKRPRTTLHIGRRARSSTQSSLHTARKPPAQAALTWQPDNWQAHTVMGWRERCCFQSRRDIQPSLAASRKTLLAPSSVRVHGEVVSKHMMHSLRGSQREIARSGRSRRGHFLPTDRSRAPT